MEPINKLNRTVILDEIGRIAPNLRVDLELLDLVDSTNTRLMNAQGHDFIPTVCVAEQQTAGRGRRGREWVSPRGSILFSIRRRFRQPPDQMMGLSLAAGVAVAEALRQFGAKDVGLKWPNDLLWRNRKLAGLLVEMSSHGSDLRAVTGVGMNYTMLEKQADNIGQPWANLTDVFDIVPERNRIIGALIGHLLNALNTFEQMGLSAFSERWEPFDLLRGKTVDIFSNETVESGVVTGIDSSGALCVDMQGHVKRFYAGEVSVRRKN